MKKINLILLFFLFCNALSFGQNKYIFEYDHSGNRILRYWIPPRLSNALPDSTVEEFSQNEGKLKITILPNPTRGKLGVDIKNADSENGVVTVFDSKGNLVSKKTFIGTKTTMDITSQPAGQYILRVATNKTTKEWVVIKTD